MVHMIQKEERKSKYAYLSTSDGGSPDFEFPVQDRANISNQKKYSAGNKFKQHIFKWASHKSWMTDMAYNAHQEITFHSLLAQSID